jgi:hypothetical protein
MGRGKDSPEEITSDRNKGRQMGKNGRGMVEKSEELGTAAPMQAGYLDYQSYG